MSSRGRVVQPPPMWARWALASILAVALIAAIVIAVNRAGPEAPTSEAGAEAEVNRVADIAITEDEAPHSANLVAGSVPALALERAIAGDVRGRIASHQLTGPLGAVKCRASGTARAARVPYRCTVRSAGITYPFLAVVNERRRQMTWCKIDQSPVANVGPEIPISASCQV
jgi:hypothetical protein